MMFILMVGPHLKTRDFMFVLEVSSPFESPFLLSNFNQQEANSVQKILGLHYCKS